MFKSLTIFIMLLLTAGCASTTLRDQPAPFNLPTQIRLAQVHVQYPVIEPPTLAVAIKDLPSPSFELHEHARFALSEAELTCMARNMYFEARGEGDSGMIAVGYVTLNRLASIQYKARTICDVVHQSGINKRTGKRSCQFSWVCAGRTVAANPRSRASYEHALMLARQVMLRTVPNPIDDSIYFHNRSVRPQFASKPLRATIGNHRFYASL